MLEKVAVIYSQAIGTVRRIVIPTIDDAELNESWHLPVAGEARLIMDRAAYSNLPGPESVQIFINAHTGRSAIHGVDDRFAVVDLRGDVVRAIVADPACANTPPPPSGHRYVRHPEATVGWQFRNEAFIAPPEEPEEG